MRLKIILFFCSVLMSYHAVSEPQNTNPDSISTAELQSFDSNSADIKRLINFSLNLTHDNLSYQYGSADPKAGAMDCSGTVYYILTQLGVKNVPRSSHLQYKWIGEKGHFYSVNSYTMDSVELSYLRPGDMLFWNGTYVVDHDPNVTHVMLYIGKNKEGQPLMVGASNGRTYKGRKIYGVSVFDFQLTQAGSKSRFLGYSCIPGLSCNNA